MMPIIGLAGKAGSGKDTVADILCSGMGGVSIAQADPLKRFAYHVLEYTEYQLWGPSEARNVIDTRSPGELRALWKSKHGGLDSPITEWLRSVGLTLTEDLLEKWASEHLFKSGISARTVLQSLGTEYGRAINSQIWADLAQRDALRLLAEPSGYSNIKGVYRSETQNNFVVLRDIRFRNEAVAVKKNGGTVVQVCGPDDTGLEGSAGTHSSETQLASIPFFWYDYTIWNDKSRGMEILKTAVKNFYMVWSEPSKVF